MEDGLIVVMLKNIESGFLEKEIGCYSIKNNSELIYNIFAVKEDGGIKISMRLSVERDLEDWEFSAVFDYYDTEVFSGLCERVTEDDTGFNPIWEVTFSFLNGEAEMEDFFEKILDIHKTELLSVYEAIKGHESEYLQV